MNKNTPIVAIDVGSLHGLQKTWKKLPEQSVIYTCDPIESLELTGINHVKHISSLLSDFVGEIEFFVTKKPDLSSIYMPNYEFIELFPNPERFKVIEKKELYSSKLDIEFAESYLDIVKIDTQGSELNILKGSRDLISNCLPYIFCEVEFEEIYLKQPLAGDVINFLYGLGYQLLDLKIHKWSRNAKYLRKQNLGSQVVWADAIFVPTPENLLSKQNSINFYNRLLLAKLFHFQSYLLDLKKNDTF